MLSLLKKNPEVSANSSNRPWHPNFRNLASLPDTKVIRTTFFINSVAGLVLVGLIVLFVSQEYKISELKANIKTLSGQINQDLKLSVESVHLYKKFQNAEKNIREWDAFIGGNKIVISEFLEQLGKSIPPNVAISTLDYNNLGINLRGLVVGTPEQASGLVSAYEKQLNADEQMKRRFDVIKLTNLSRDSQNGRLSFEIILRSSKTKEVKKL
jgi:Tfp pilus assembly protein PilN